MAYICSWLLRSVVAFVAAGAFTAALAATPALVGVFRDGHWFLDANGNNAWDGTPTDIHYTFGMAGDIPVVGDWNGDGITKIGVFRNGVWYLDYNGNGVWDGEPVDKVITFGLATDVPVVGDWNKDGRSKIGVFRGYPVEQSRSVEFFLDSNGNGVWDPGADQASSLGGSFGDTNTNTPVIGDWEGDGNFNLGLFVRRDNFFNWRLSDAATTGGRSPLFGLKSDDPVVGDWSGDGFTKIGVFRDGAWYLDYDNNGHWDGPTTDRAFNFGVAGDKPLIAKRWR